EGAGRAAVRSRRRSAGTGQPLAARLSGRGAAQTTFLWLDGILEQLLDRGPVDWRGAPRNGSSGGRLRCFALRVSGRVRAGVGPLRGSSVTERAERRSLLRSPVAQRSAPRRRVSARRGLPEPAREPPLRDLRLRDEGKAGRLLPGRRRLRALHRADRPLWS